MTSEPGSDRGHFRGTIERVEGQELVGWLVDESNLSRRVAFALVVNGRECGRHFADLPRRLLRNRGYDDWNHGYRIDIGSHLGDGGRARIELHIDRSDVVHTRTFEGTDAEASGAPRERDGVARPTPPRPEPRRRAEGEAPPATRPSPLRFPGADPAGFADVGVVAPAPAPSWATPSPMAAARLDAPAVLPGHLHPGPAEAATSTAPADVASDPIDGTAASLALATGSLDGAFPQIDVTPADEPAPTIDDAPTTDGAPEPTFDVVLATRIPHELSDEQRDALCLLLVDRPARPDERQRSRGDLLERLLHSGSLGKILDTIVEARSAPQDLTRGRPPAALKAAVSGALGLGEAGIAAMDAAATWTAMLSIALATDEVRTTLSSARPAEKGAYLVDRARLCEHLVRHPQAPFQATAHDDGERLRIDVEGPISPDTQIRLAVGDDILTPTDVAPDGRVLRLAFALPTALDDGRVHYARLTFGPVRAHVFPPVPLRLRRSAEPRGVAVPPDAAPAPRPPLWRVGNELALGGGFRVVSGTQEVAASEARENLAAWRLHGADLDEGTPLVVLTADGREIWRGPFGALPQDPRLAALLDGIRIHVDRSAARLLLAPGEEPVGIALDGEPLPVPPAVPDATGLLRDVVVPLPLAALDGAPHALAFTVRDAGGETAYAHTVCVAPTLDEWADLVTTRGAAAAAGLAAAGRADVIEDLIRDRGDTLGDDLLTDLLLGAIVATRSGPLSAPIRDAFAVLWYRASKQPAGLERFARRILARVPAMADAAEWRVIQQQPLKDALTDIAIYLCQTGDQGAENTAVDAARALFGLDRPGLAQTALAASAAPTGAETERLRLRALRRRGEMDAAVASAIALRGRGDRTVEPRRALVEHLLEHGDYLGAAAVGTEGRGLSMPLTGAGGDRRVARDTFPLRWTGWASAAFAGSGGDGEAALARLAALQTLPAEETLSVFLTRDGVGVETSRDYHRTLAPRPALTLLAPDQTCGSLPVFTDWAVVVHGPPPAPAILNQVLAMRIATEDLLLVEAASSPEHAVPCAFAVRATHLAFVSDFAPAEAAARLAARLRHRTVLIASE